MKKTLEEKSLTQTYELHEYHNIHEIKYVVNLYKYGKMEIEIRYLYGTNYNI